MKIIGKASDVVDAIEYARGQMKLTFEALQVKTDKSKERWIAKKLRWWGRDQAYWEKKWIYSSRKNEVERWNGVAWLQGLEANLNRIAQRVDALPYFSEYTLEECDLEAMSYEHKDY